MDLLMKDNPSRCPASDRTSKRARHPGDAEKKQMALAAIRGECVSKIARRFQVSRKCVYVQKARAMEALDAEFSEKTGPEERVIFTVAFTDDLVTRLVLAMYLCGKSSYRAIQRIFKDIFSFDISLGKLSAIVTSAAQSAAKINASYDVRQISVACHDEFFHDNKPYVVAVEPLSRFCFLLETAAAPLDQIWIQALKKLKADGYAPDYITADGGGSLRNSLNQVLPGTPCFYDIFHLIRYFGQVILAIKRDRALLEVCKNNCLARLQHAAQNGYSNPDAFAAFQESERRLEAHNANILLIQGCIGRMLRKTTNTQRRSSPEERLASYEKTQAVVYEVCRTYSVEAKSRRPLQNLISILNGQKENILGLYACVGHAPIVRASSMVENFNHSLRQQTRRFLHLDQGFKELALFYLNHQRFLVSKSATRTGSSPAELFLGHSLPPWLDLLTGGSNILLPKINLH